MTEFIPGKKYKMRNGTIVICLTRNTYNEDFPWVFSQENGFLITRREGGSVHNCMQDSIDVLPEEVIESVEFEPEVKGSGVMIPWIHIPMQFSGKRIRVRIEVIEGEGK
jgi:hypothetical protein